MKLQYYSVVTWRHQLMTDSMPRNSARHSNQNTINNRDTFLVVLACYLCYKGRGGGHASQQSQATMLSFLFWFTEKHLKRQQQAHHTSKDEKRKTHQKNCLESKVCPHGSHNRHVECHPWLDGGRRLQVNTAYAGIAHTPITQPSSRDSRGSRVRMDEFPHSWSHWTMMLLTL